MNMQIHILGKPLSDQDWPFLYVHNFSAMQRRRRPAANARHKNDPLWEQ